VSFPLLFSFFIIFLLRVPTFSKTLKHLLHPLTKRSLAADAKGAKKGGTRQFNGLADVYRKIYSADGIAGLYRGFGISSAGIFVYRGFYFGLYDSVKAILPSGIQDNFIIKYV
jgi:hypothetical protein